MSLNIARELLYPDNHEYTWLLPSGHDLTLVSSFFIRKAGSWSLPNIPAPGLTAVYTMPGRQQYIFDTIYELLSLEEYSIGMGYILDRTLS